MARRQNFGQWLRDEFEYAVVWMARRFRTTSATPAPAATPPAPVAPPPAPAATPPAAAATPTATPAAPATPPPPLRMILNGVFGLVNKKSCGCVASVVILLFSMACIGTMLYMFQGVWTPKLQNAVATPQTQFVPPIGVAQIHAENTSITREIGANPTQYYLMYRVKYWNGENFISVVTERMFFNEQDYRAYQKKHPDLVSSDAPKMYIPDDSTDPIWVWDCQGGFKFEARQGGLIQQLTPKELGKCPKE